MLSIDAIETTFFSSVIAYELLQLHDKGVNFSHTFMVNVSAVVEPETIHVGFKLTLLGKTD